MGDSPIPVPSFGAKENETSRTPLVAIAIGVAAVLIVLAALVFFNRKAPGDTPASAVADPYASNLAISNLAMSTAANFAGQEVTYIEGKVKNNGQKTVTNAMVQIVFHDSLGQVAQKETQ